MMTNLEHCSTSFGPSIHSKQVDLWHLCVQVPGSQPAIQPNRHLLSLSQYVELCRQFSHGFPTRLYPKPIAEKGRRKYEKIYGISWMWLFVFH